MSIYECRGYCINMKPKLKIDRSESGLRYTCKLTNNDCVGSKEKWRKSKEDTLNPEIIELCPERITIDDVLKENEELKKALEEARKHQYEFSDDAPVKENE